MVAPLGNCGLLTRPSGLGQGLSPDGLMFLHRRNRKQARLCRQPKGKSISATLVQHNPEPSRPSSPLLTLALRIAAGAALVLPLAGSMLGVTPRAAHAEGSSPLPPPASMPADSVIDERTGLAKPWLYRSGLWSQEQYRWVHKFYTSPRVPRPATPDVAVESVAVAAAADALGNGLQQSSRRQQLAGLTWHPGSMSVNLPNPMDMTDPNNPLATPTGRVVASAALAAMVLLLLRVAMPRQRDAEMAGGTGGLDDDDHEEDGGGGAAAAGSAVGPSPPREEMSEAQRRALVEDSQRRIEQAKRAMAFAQQAQQETQEQAFTKAEEAQRAELEAAALAQQRQEEEEQAQRAEREAAARAQQQQEEEQAQRVEQEAVLQARMLEQQQEALRAQQQEAQQAQLLRAQQEEVQRALELEQQQEAQHARQLLQQQDTQEAGEAGKEQQPSTEQESLAQSLAATDAGEMAAPELPHGVAAMLAAGTIKVDDAAADVAAPGAPLESHGLTTDFMGMMAAGTITAGGAAEPSPAEDDALPADVASMMGAGTISSPDPTPEPATVPATATSAPAPPPSDPSKVPGSVEQDAGPYVLYRFADGDSTPAANVLAGKAASGKLSGAGRREGGALSLGDYLAGRGSEGPAYATLGLLSAAAGVFAQVFKGSARSQRSVAEGKQGGAEREWDAVSLLLAPAAPLVAALPKQGAGARVAVGSRAGAKKYDMLLTMLEDALQQPDVQGDERYDPVRSLLRMAPLTGPQRYDFAASLLKGMVEEDSVRSADAVQAGKRFDMVWDLVHAMRTEVESRGEKGAGRSKYDPLWVLLEEAKLEQAWGAAPLDPLAGLSQWGPPSDWDSPAPYDPLPDLLASLQGAPKDSKYDPMSSLLNTLSFLAAGPPRGKSKYDMLADVLAAMGQHSSDARSARAAGAAPAKLDAWGWLVQRALRPSMRGSALPAGKYDPLAGRALRFEAPAGVAKYDMLPSLWRVDAPTVISKYDVAQAVLEGSWVSLVGADPLEVASGAVGGLMHSMQSRGEAMERGSRAARERPARGGGAGVGSPAVAMDKME